MKIRLTKETETKPGTTHFLRSDSSCTWQKSSAFFAEHDLIHYAVETTLGYRKAFLGLLSEGRDLNSFGTQNGIKDVYTEEELWAEAIIGVCHWPDTKTNSPQENRELLDILAKTFEGRHIPAPRITPEEFFTIRSHIQELQNRWDAVPAGESLELTF